MRICVLFVCLILIILCQGQFSHNGLSYDDLSTWLQGFNWMQLGRQVCQCHMYHHHKYCQWSHKDQQIQCLGQCLENSIIIKNQKIHILLFLQKEMYRKLKIKYDDECTYSKYESISELIEIKFHFLKKVEAVCLL